MLLPNDINQQPDKIFRFGAPSKMDTAKTGTHCYVAQVNKPYEYEVYQQCSSNEEEPNWIFVDYIKES